jgi:hypothetical protein
MYNYICGGIMEKIYRYPNKLKSINIYLEHRETLQERKFFLVILLPACKINGLRATPIIMGAV